MTIKVLGTGCKKCRELEQNVKMALAQLQLDVQVEKVEDIEKIMSYGVMSTPALVINEKVVSTGKLLSVDEVLRLLK
ncbi:thioredoxin family protein [Anoxybacillus flavithermus]|uniref:Thioredoxin family protein n=1 Tax=Anoxybacillus flavithermus (strain DSM 21510 / WK1) TaxID=491915 RepID=B7GJR0_ANOFW|nr:thioredoxin family protein [Anoxybacillus flavithermus]ACJ33923.1 Thioredoxin family protein [Anoxybacillus flavithermus WK1]AST07412.1 redox-active disulfide protein 2 [Anoxybacillus flavithermus]